MKLEATMRLEEKRTVLYGVALNAIVVGLMILPMGTGNLFGAGGDWDSQHVGAAELLRQTMLTQGTLFPQFVTAGGGSSVYDFAYYGFLRPDVVLSCLLPQVDMQYLIAGYSMVCVIVSANLCRLWLGRQGVSQQAAFWGSVMFAASTCFLHAHRQIVFVNYMPFLILALLGVDRLLERKQSLMLILALVMVYLHSFYYAPACLAACGLYGVYKLYLRRKMWDAKDGELEERPGRTILRAAFAVAVSLGLAAVVLLPTALDILSTSKDAGGFAQSPLKPVDGSLSGLLYQSYGCGMTMVTLYCLLAAAGKALGTLQQNSEKVRQKDAGTWQEKLARQSGHTDGKLARERALGMLAGALLIIAFVPGIWLVLNGFLYARAKILIPFVPLIALVCGRMLQEFLENPKRMPQVPALLCLIPAICSVRSNVGKGMVLDALLLTAVVALVRTRGKRMSKTAGVRWVCGLMVVPLVVSFVVNRNENWFPKDGWKQNPFTAEELAEAGVFSSENGYGSMYRVDTLCDSLTNANTVPDGRVQQTSMYSSITNSLYSTFYYDTMGNPISIQNRVALLPSQNPLFHYVMGVKYLICEADQVPAGYEKRMEKDGYVVAENRSVLPVCYGTGDLMAEGDFEKLEYQDRLLALCGRAIVPADEAAEQSSSSGEAAGDDFEGGWTRVCDLETVIPSELVEEELTAALSQALGAAAGAGKASAGKAGAGEAGSGETGEMSGACAAGAEEAGARGTGRKLLLVRFGVDSPTEDEVAIEIGGMKNKLASRKAPYPNRNYQFTYVLAWDTERDGTEIPVTASSPGRYTMDNLQVYVMDLQSGSDLPGDLGRSDSAELPGGGNLMRQVITPEVDPWEPDGRTMFRGVLDMEEDGWMITSYPYRAGYRVLVDGEKAEPQKVNTAFVGVPLTAGRHTIDIAYEAPGFGAGLKVSLASLALAVAACLAQHRRKIRKQQTKEDLGK